MGVEQVVQSAWEAFHAGDPERAKRLLRSFLVRSPSEPNANKLLAMIHGALREDQLALVHIARAAASSPRDTDIAFMHGNVLFMLGRHAESAAAMRRCLAIDPAHVSAIDVLSKCLLTVGDEAEALAVYERAITVNPGVAQLHVELVRMLREVGRCEEAAAAVRRGVQACPNDPAMLQQVCYTLNFVVCDEDELTQYHRRAATAVCGSGAIGHPESVVRPVGHAGRRVRVAVLSSDFCDHACGTFMMPLLTRLGKQPDIELFLYSVTTAKDAWTERFAACGHWRELAAADRGQLEECARADGIDVLVECNGWTAGTRVHMLRPPIAPVQATWLGYPNTTGCDAIHARIIDAVTDPHGSERLATERLARLAGCFLCYEPAADCPPISISPGLASADGVITFGSFNRVSKMSEQTLMMWAAVLRQVPNSRLLLKARVQSDALNAAMLKRLAAHGIEPARMHFSPYANAHHDHMALYSEIDIALDTSPYCGTTTTCEALWMGVPVVTLAGESHRARVGASLLTAAGLGRLVGRSAEQYVQIAVGLASDRAGLRAMHETMRETLRRSELLDCDGYATRFAALLRDLATGFKSGAN